MEPEQPNVSAPEVQPVLEAQPAPVSAPASVPVSAPASDPVSAPASAPATALQPAQAMAPQLAPAPTQPAPKAKSKTTAGLLGIFLGAIGAHNWYLGEKAKGIAHVCMFFSSVPSVVVINLVLPNVRTLSSVMQTEAVFDALSTFFALIIIASAIWGLIEGIIILAKRQ